MSEDNNNNSIPQLDPSKIPEFLQDEEWFQEDTSGLYLDFTKPYKPPRWTLSHDGIPFAKMGDLHVIQGKAGHGKTALMTQFMACLLSGSFGHLRCELKQPVKVLYIDTDSRHAINCVMRAVLPCPAFPWITCRSPIFANGMPSCESVQRGGLYGLVKSRYSPLVSS